MNKKIINNIVIYETIINEIEKELKEVSKGIYKNSDYYKIKKRLLNNINMYKKKLNKIKKEANK
jgi:hypothetical protein